MSAEEDGSITVWVNSLKAGREVDAATRALWERYFANLVRLAHARLSKAGRGLADGEDVALSTLESVCRGVSDGRFPQLDDREDLWRILVHVTGRKASNVRRDEARQKRGGGRTVGEGDFGGADTGRSPLDEFPDSEPTPEDAAMFVEECNRLLGLLPDDVLRQVARLKMEGYLNDEIRQRLGLSLKTVERKLALIRKRWEQEGVG